jgi:pyrroloquinoline quinone biosynthesis protein B
MRVVLLGAAAGGGLPQWNCACPNCVLARAGKIPSSTQSSVAFSADGVHWFLINASPDLPRQIESSLFLQPQTTSGRHSPIEGVLLTNADLDHVLGLILMREGGRLQLHAPAGVREALAHGLHFETLAGAFGGADWHLPPETDLQPLLLREGGKSGLNYRLHPLANDPPRYAKSAGGIQSVAYEIHDPRTGSRLMMAPDVAAVSPAFLEALGKVDAVLFDGTFWSSNELREIQGSARTSEQMGHLPISGGSLDILRKLSARHKIYVHINNTNPVWQLGSPARKEVEQSGLQIGYDGLTFEL